MNNKPKHNPILIIYYLTSFIHLYNLQSFIYYTKCALTHAQWPTQCSNASEISSTAVFRLVVQKSQRESAHAQNFQFKIPTKRARMHGFSSRFLDNQHETAVVFWLVVQKSRRESAHARTLDGQFELKIMRMRGFSSRFLDNQPETSVLWFYSILQIAKNRKPSLSMLSAQFLPKLSN